MASIFPNWFLTKLNKTKKMWKAIKIDVKTLRAQKLLLYIASYGFALNYAVMVVFDKPFNPITLFGWGFVFYFLRVELMGAVKEAKMRKLTVGGIGGPKHGIDIATVRTGRRNIVR